MKIVLGISFNTMLDRKVTLLLANGKSYEFLVKCKKDLLMKVLTNGLSESGVVDMLLGKKPAVIHTLSVKNMGLNSQNKPIDPRIVAKRVRLKKRLIQMYLFTCIYMDTCTYCESEKITHCLVKGSLIQGYEELPICKKCAEIIDKSNDH